MQDLLLGREQTLCKMGGKVFPDHLSLKSEALTCVPSDSPLPQSQCREDRCFGNLTQSKSQSM